MTPLPPLTILYGMFEVRTAAGLWGYAEGNRTAVGIAVVVVALAAVLYVTRRWWRR